MEDREYQEFLQWLEFKRQRTQETTVVVTAEQPQLRLETDSTPKRTFTQCADAPNYRKPYTSIENHAIRDLIGAGWGYAEIGELLGRSWRAIQSQWLDNVKGIEL
jgi:hypothetical protein